MSQQVIGQGPSNLVPDTEIKQFLASAAILRGAVVAMTSANTTGYTVVSADTDDANGIQAIGVAAEAIASGDWGDVIVSGFCDYLITDTNIVAGSPLTTTGTTAGQAGVGTIGTHDIFGIALAADSTNLCTKSMIFKRL